MSIKMDFNNIAVIGAGYVGLSMACLLSKISNIQIIEIDENKVKKINDGESPISDKLVQRVIKSKKNIDAYTDINEIVKNVDLIIICLPTNYNPTKNEFDTQILDNALKDIFTEYEKDQINILIKSTIPVGYINKVRKKYKTNKIIFCPEFLREGYALYDNLYPSRIVIGDKSDVAKDIAGLFKSLALNNPEIFYLNSIEAESVKLFSNTFLAMRVSFFNELDNYCLNKDLDASSIINAVSADPRILNVYNNPSFGYGGYCLPKDTKQLLSNFEDTPQNLISAIIKSNVTRKKYIADQILKLKPKIVGIYRLIMKEHSDNYRDSAIFDIIDILISENVDLIIYEPLINEEHYQDIRIEKDLKNFKNSSSIIIANRTDTELDDVASKIFTRELKKNDY